MDLFKSAMSISTLGADFIDIAISGEAHAIENMWIDEDGTFDSEVAFAENMLPANSSHFKYLNGSRCVAHNRKKKQSQRPPPNCLAKTVGPRNALSTIAPAGKGHSPVNVVIKRSPRW